MDRPEQGDYRGQRQSYGAPAVAHCRQQKRPPDDAEQHKGRQNVNGQVRRMITPDLVTADPIVDSQGEIQDRAASNSLPPGVWWAERLPDGPELPDRRVLDDCRDVIVDQGARETTAVSRHCGQHDQPRRQHDHPTRSRSRKSSRQRRGLLVAANHTFSGRSRRSTPTTFGAVAMFHGLKKYSPVRKDSQCCLAATAGRERGDRPFSRTRERA